MSTHDRVPNGLDAYALDRPSVSPNPMKRAMQWKGVADELYACLMELMNDGARYPDPITGEEIRHQADTVRVEEAIKTYNAAKNTL